MLESEAGCSGTAYSHHLQKAMYIGLRLGIISVCRVVSLWVALHHLNPIVMGQLVFWYVKLCCSSF
jgi:hypothetical protein